MKKVSEMIVYLSETPDEWLANRKKIISRIALHPMIIESDNLKDLNNTNYKEKEIFLFRVAFKTGSCWCYSCLGTDNDNESVYIDDYDKDYYDPGDVIKDGTIDNALKWLLDGEEDMEKLL